MRTLSETFEKEFKEELISILEYWQENTLDGINGGFIGQVDVKEIKHLNAEKGSVMVGRILWSFSAAYSFLKEEKYLKIAQIAFEEIKTKFFDPQNKGIYWSINANGTPKDTKNQIYALAFVIYGLSEFYKISQNKEALELAITLYKSIQKYSFDKNKKGYFEAYTQDWQELSDVRLSDKDANEKKTMNTHLHIVEAFANLYLVWKDNELQQHIVEILKTIDNYFIDKESWHLKLFFDENWKERKDVISYGHDIEAAWLLQWCAEVSENKELIEKFTHYAIKMAEVTKEGIDADGGLWYEYNPQTQELCAEKHWWPQAELLIGYMNAYQLTHKEDFLNGFQKNWEFIKKYIIDKEHGEWYWGVDKNYHIIPKDKAGFWKCPYHNSRACLEILKRIK